MLVLDEKTNNKAWCSIRDRANEKGLVRVLEEAPSKIQEWFERIPEHIKKIIDCKGGSEYKEGLGKKRRRNPDRVH
jgi:hypothetical protein